MAREPELERQRRDVVGVRQLDQGARDPKAREVLVQRDALGSLEEIRQVRWRRTDLLRDLAQAQTIAESLVEDFFRAANEARRRRCRLLQPANV